MDRTDTGDPGKCSKLTLRICVCEAFTCYFLLENGWHWLITDTENRIRYCALNLSGEIILINHVPLGSSDSVRT